MGTPNLGFVSYEKTDKRANGKGIFNSQKKKKVFHLSLEA